MAASVKGGKKWKEALKPYAEANKTSVSVGILAGATYPDGQPVAAIAAVHEFGGQINKPARQQTMYFKRNKDGGVGNRFVKKSESDFAQEVAVGAHTITIPARSFMRSTLAEKKGEWGKEAAAALKSNRGDIKKALAAVGEVATKDMTRAIETGIDPALSANTVAAKRHRKGSKGRPDLPLVDTGAMEEALGYEVSGAGRQVFPNRSGA